MAVSANRLELLQIADAVAREKSIEKQIVIDAMADAIQKVARSRYGQETNIRADINPTTGEMKLQRLMEVVDSVEDCFRRIALGESGLPKSPHWSDQLADWRAVTPRVFPFTQPAILEATKETLVLEPLK